MFRKTSKVKCHSHHIIPRIDAVNRTTYYCYIDLDHVADNSVCQVFSLFSILYSLEGMRTYAPSPESRIST